MLFRKEMGQFPDHAQLANLSIIEEEYQRYLADPNSVDSSWRHFFEGIDFAAFLYKRPETAEGSPTLRILGLIGAYRRYGHLLANINPLRSAPDSVRELDLEVLGFSKSELDQLFPTLGFCASPNAPLKEIIASLHEVYCTRIGFEYIDIDNPELQKWIQKKIEPKLVLDLTVEEKRLLLEYLNKSEVFETFLQTRYGGQTRFSIEGNETAIPMLAEIIEEGAKEGVEDLWIGMAHRGRLNVLANILNKPYSVIFEEFEDDTTLSFFGNDDVKYHVGFSGEYTVRSGKKVAVSFPANPSHLESVDAPLLGQTYAVQVLKKDQEKKRVMPILVHGDAALAGQGVVYESMQLMRLRGYSTGGTIHLVLNNQIGYTTLPEEGRSTRYCTDIAKAFGVPVFHVNAEDPESCLFVARLAVEIRQRFQSDVFIDLLGYRKYGHNEGDEPSYTQPLQYQIIRSKKTIRQIYFEELLAKGHVEQKIAEMLETEFKETLKKALTEVQAKRKKEQALLPSFDPFLPLQTGVERSVLQKVIETFCTVPKEFHLHPKLEKWLQERKKTLEGKVDWSAAECLAFGSLLLEKISIRLAGQDSRRGTFSQRHMVWTDVENGSLYSPFTGFGEGRFEIINSPLSEYACLGFEYGYSAASRNVLVLWEAQYGDFVNGGEIIIDQYIVSAEQKWKTTSLLTLLLPHGYEGAGPEHSSCRVERFLQLAAADNIQVVYPSTPSQYFHVLRRQAKRSVRKPLIILAPKSILRASFNMSPIDDFVKGSFQEILDDPFPQYEAFRLLLCSGKIYYDLMQEREKRQTKGVAIVRLEQYYPFFKEALQKTIGLYKQLKEIVWVQEEPENMGAWTFLAPRLQALLPKGVSLKKISRPSSSTPATGSHQKHLQEQKTLLDAALNT